MTALRQDIESNFTLLKNKALYITSGDDDLADEILQDGICKMLANELQYVPSTFMGWAFCIIRNIFIDKK